MNVLVIGKFFPDSFASHIAETLASMGHSVDRHHPGIQYQSSGGRWALRWQRLRGLAYRVTNRIPGIRDWRFSSLEQKASPETDLIINTYDDFLRPDEVSILRDRAEAPIILWFPDHVANLNRAYCLHAPYDALFFKDPLVVRRLSVYTESPVYYLPECFNPSRHRLPDDETTIDFARYECDVTTAGNLHPFRVALFRQLSNYHVKLWGNPPPSWLNADQVSEMFQEKYVANEEKAVAFTAGKIVINNLYPAEHLGLNVRAFEVAGVGGFQLIRERPRIDHLFKVGKEIVTFSDVEELKEKIDYYLAHAKERKQIARAAHERAQAEHTYEDRLRLLFESVEGSQPGFPMPDLNMA